jgi:hypothetical protein
MGLRVSLRSKRLLLTRPWVAARFARGTDQAALQKRKAMRPIPVTSPTTNGIELPYDARPFWQLHARSRLP